MSTWAERAKAAISQKCQNGTAETDETAVSRLLAVSAVAKETVSAKPEQFPSVLAAPSQEELVKRDSSIAAIDGLDRRCFLHSTAMNVREIDALTLRLARFSNKGLTLLAAERLADKLAMRDRESDARRVCMECDHLAGYGAGSWRCVNWKVAGVSIRERDSQLPADFVVLLQLCDGHINFLKPLRNPRQ